jgi:hypothetical protein
MLIAIITAELFVPVPSTPNGVALGVFINCDDARREECANQSQWQGFGRTGELQVQIPFTIDLYIRSTR